jgi:hypothetical protein
VGPFFLFAYRNLFEFQQVFTSLFFIFLFLRLLRRSPIRPAVRIWPAVTRDTNVSLFFRCAACYFFQFQHVFTSFFKDLKGGTPFFSGIPLDTSKLINLQAESRSYRPMVSKSNRVYRCEPVSPLFQRLPFSVQACFHLLIFYFLIFTTSAEKSNPASSQDMASSNKGYKCVLAFPLCRVLLFSVPACFYLLFK